MRTLHSRFWINCKTPFWLLRYYHMRQFFTFLCLFKKWVKIYLSGFWHFSYDYEKHIFDRLSISPKILVKRISQERYDLQTSNLVCKSVGHTKIVPIILSFRLYVRQWTDYTKLFDSDPSVRSSVLPYRLKFSVSRYLQNGDV